MTRFIAYFFVGFYFCGLGTVLAETLQTAKDPAGGTNWLQVGGGIAMVALLIVLGIIGYKAWRAKHPVVPVVVPVVTDPSPVQQVGTALSADATAIVATVNELLGHLKDTAAATSAKVAPAGGEGVAGVLICKVTGTPSLDIPAITSAYFAKGTKRPA